MSTLSGTIQGFADGSAVSSLYYAPLGVASDAGGNLFVMDSGNARIRRINWLTMNVSTVAGNGFQDEHDGVGTDAHFYYPFGLAILNGSLLVVDNSAWTVRRIGMLSCFPYLI